MADRSEAGAPRRGLGPGMTTFLVVDVILVVTFLVLLVMSQTGGGIPSAAPSSPSASVPAEETPEPTPPEETEEAQALPAFVLPSGNIWCEMTETSATCTILEFSFAPPDPPAGCAGTAGNVVTVTADDAAFACVEGAATPAPEGTPVLDYGGGSTVGEMTCLSSRNGVFCRHNPSGTGFSLARAGAQFF